MKPALKAVAAALASGFLAAAHAQMGPPPPAAGMTMPHAEPGYAPGPAPFQQAPGPAAAWPQQPVGLIALSAEQLQNTMSAEQMLRSRVRAADGEHIGRVEDIIALPDGGVSALMVSSGGLLGVGTAYYRVPSSHVQVRPGVRELFVRLTREQLERFRVADRQQIGPHEWRVSDLIRDRVYTRDGVGYGSVQDVFIGLEGRVRAVIVAGGGPFAGMFAYPFDPQTFDARRNVHTLPLTRSQVTQLLPIHPDSLRIVTLGEHRTAPQPPIRR
jgi:sporulation protein YlmC with PRC-barrel domain